MSAVLRRSSWSDRNRRSPARLYRDWIRTEPRAVCKAAMLPACKRRRMRTFNMHIDGVVRIAMHSAAHSQMVWDAAGRSAISHDAS